MVSSESVYRQVRGDPYSSETSEELLHEPTQIPNPNENEDHEQVLVDPNSDISEKCQIRLMIDQGVLMIPKPIKSQKQIKREPR